MTFLNRHKEQSRYTGLVKKKKSRQLKQPALSESERDRLSTFMSAINIVQVGDKIEWQVSNESPSLIDAFVDREMARAKKRIKRK